MGGEAPRILSLDDYFECDGEVDFKNMILIQIFSCI